MHEALDEQGDGRFFVQASAHEVVKLVSVHRGAGSTMRSGDLVSEDFEFGDGFRTCFFGEQEIPEHLTRIAVIRVFSNRQQTGGDGMTLVVTSGVNVEG